MLRPFVCVRDGYNYEPPTRASRKAAKKQQQASNKYSKQQQKAMRNLQRHSERRSSGHGKEASFSGC